MLGRRLSEFRSGASGIKLAKSVLEDLKPFAVPHTYRIINYCAVNSERFGTEAALAKLAADWPAARLIETWNSLPGETPVKKFKDRHKGILTPRRRMELCGMRLRRTSEAPESRRPFRP
jgi:hypothetical protein